MGNTALVIDSKKMLERQAKVYVDKYQKIGRAEAEKWALSFYSFQHREKLAPYIVEEFKHRGYKMD